MLHPQHFHNNFTANPRWQVVTGSNLGRPLKLLSCLPVIEQRIENDKCYIHKIFTTILQKNPRWHVVTGSNFSRPLKLFSCLPVIASLPRRICCEIVADVVLLVENLFLRKQHSCPIKYVSINS